jgi:hypothetical protein
MSTFWGYFLTRWPKKRSQARKKRRGKKCYLKNLFEFSLNYGFCGLPSKHYSIFDFISLSSSLFAVRVPHFGDIFASFLNEEFSHRYRQLLRILSNIYHAIFQITSSVVACYCSGLFSPTRSLPSFTF